MLGPKNSIAVRSLAIFIIALLLWATNLPIITSPDTEQANMTNFTEPLQFSNALSYIDYDMLASFLGGDVFLNPGNFTRLVQESLIPANVALVGLSVGWEQHANTTSTNIPYYQWVDDFLSITDLYEIKVVFHFGSWNITTKAPSWGNDVVTANPELSSDFYDAVHITTGQSNSIIIDSPLVVDQLEEDLIQLYHYYGKHTSWIGFAFGRPGSLTYAPLDGTPSDQMVQEYSLHSFFDTIYYKRNVDTQGFHVDGTKCKLWQEYLENEPLVEFKSGDRQMSVSIDVYGGKDEGGHCLATRIEFNSDLEGFQIQWYGKRQGMPGDLVLELYEDDVDMPRDLGNPLETIVVPVEKIVETSNTWQPPIRFSSSVSRDMRYWIIIYSEGNNRNKYSIYRNEYRLDDETHVRYTSNGYDGDWEGFGSACIILKDLHGVQQIVCPFHSPYNKVILSGTEYSQSFTATANVTINAIWLYLVDRAMANDPRPLPVRLVKVSDNAVIAKGELSIQYTQGTYWWSMVPLDRRVTIYEGQEYRIELGPGPKDCILWQFLMDKTDPPEYGFQGKQNYLLFALADMNIDPSLTSYSDSIPILLYKDPITMKDWMAVGFLLTTRAKLDNFSIKITKTGEPSDLKIALYDDDPRPSSWYGLSKPRTLVEEQVVAASDVPSDGWLLVGGWKALLDPGRYWIILSQTSPSNGYYRVPSKNPNYILPLEYSTDNGSNWRWGFPYTNTPAEPLVRISTSTEVISNEPWEVLAFFELKNNISAAQSFILDKEMTVRGINMWLSQRFDRYEEVIVQITSDSSDVPSKMILGETTVKPGEGLFSGSSLVVFDFSYPLKLRPGKYWVVVKAQRLFIPIVIWDNPDYGFGGSKCKAKVTYDGGLTWSPPEGKESDLVFSIVESPIDPRYNVEDLATDITNYHTQAMWLEPLQGWNVYLNVQTSKIQGELIRWFDTYTGRYWISIDPNPPDVLEEVDGKDQLYSILEVEDSPSKSIISAIVEHPNIKIMPSLDFNVSNLNESEAFYQSLLPITGRPLTLLSITDLQELQSAKVSTISYLWNITKRIAYAGDYFGMKKGGTNILLIGDQDSLEFARYLKSMVNITFIEPNRDYNFTKFGNFSHFKVIIWTASKQSMDEVNENAQVRIKDFINKGGAIILMNAWSKWADDIVGFSDTEEKIQPGSINHVDYEHPIVRPYSNMPEYSCPWSEDVILPMHTNVTYVITDTNSQPVISMNSYGAGHGLLFGAPISVFSGSEDGFITMLVNSIFYLASEKEHLPVIWHRDLASPGTQHLYYSITGRQGGPILIWLTNSGPTVRFDLCLSSSFLNIDPKGWVLFDLVKWLPIMRGKGDNISVSLEAIGKSWTAVCIVNATGDSSKIIYSTDFIHTERLYPNQVLYTLTLPLAREIWEVIDAPSSPDSILVDNSSVPMIRSLPLVNSTTMQCWYYEYETQILLVKLLSKGTQTIRVLNTPLQIPSPILPKVAFIVILFCVMIFEIVATKKRKRPADTG